MNSFLNFSILTYLNQFLHRIRYNLPKIVNSSIYSNNSSKPLFNLIESNLEYHEHIPILINNLCRNDHGIFQDESGILWNDSGIFQEDAEIFQDDFLIM